MKNIFAFTKGDGCANWVAVYVFEAKVELPLNGNTGWFNHDFRILEARLVIDGKQSRDIIRVYAPDSSCRNWEGDWRDALKDAEELKTRLVEELEYLTKK